MAAACRPQSPECLGLHIGRADVFGDVERASKRRFKGLAIWGRVPNSVAKRDAKPHFVI